MSMYVSVYYTVTDWHSICLCCIIEQCCILQQRITRIFYIAICMPSLYIVYIVAANYIGTIYAYILYTDNNGVANLIKIN